MGMDRTVTFAPGKVPDWNAARDLLAQHGYAVQVRMIDGELAFPNEEPPASWRELRIGTPQGMVTVRRQGDSLVFVTWGNADVALVQAWNALTWAFAAAGDGQVLTEEGKVTADLFRKQSELPIVLQEARDNRDQSAEST